MFKKGLNKILYQTATTFKNIHQYIGINSYSYYNNIIVDMKKVVNKCIFVRAKSIYVHNVSLNVVLS